MSNAISTKRRKAVAIVDDGELCVSDGADLNVREAAFVKAFTEGETAGDQTKSYVVAGYSPNSAATGASRLARSPKILAAIDAAIRDRITGTLTVKAVRLAEKVLNDEDAPLKLRADMARSVVEWSGVVQRAQQEKAANTGLDGTKPLAQMNRADLEALVRNGADLLKAAASLPGPGQVIEGGSENNSAHTETPPDE